MPESITFFSVSTFPSSKKDLFDPFRDQAAHLPAAHLCAACTIDVPGAEPVFQYLFAKHNGRLSCWHSGELVYAFHMIPEDSSLYEADDRALSDMMHAYWLNFAKNGTPGGEGLPRFENNADSARIMRFENGAAMEAEPYLKLYAILDGMYGFQ